MKDYASMSDQQINREVQKLTGMGCMCGNGVLIISNGMWRTFDPCNNPADAWPIITENRISTIYLDENEWGCRGDGDKSACRAINSNALRCAMIVFLMMKESEND